MFQFNERSLKLLPQLHPDIQRVLTEAIRHAPFEFQIICASRNQADQEDAKRRGASKAGFGDSPHNYFPSIAVDVTPVPLDWNNHRQFEKLGAFLQSEFKRCKVPFRWGGDFNGDGNATTKDSWDKPHYELHPWRDYANGSKLFGARTSKPAAAKPAPKKKGTK